MSRRLLAPSALLLAALLGCGGDASGWLARARALSAQADAAQARGELQASAAALEELCALAAPRAVTEDDRRALLQDARARLASIALAAGDPAGAERQAEAGLALGDGRDLYQAALLILRGRAREALGRDREATGDLARAAALDEALLDQLLSTGGDR